MIMTSYLLLSFPCLPTLLRLPISGPLSVSQSWSLLFLSSSVPSRLHGSSFQPSLPMFLALTCLFFFVIPPMATHSSILAWRTPWTEEPGGLQSLRSQRVGHDWAISLHFPLLNQTFNFFMMPGLLRSLGGNSQMVLVITKVNSWSLGALSVGSKAFYVFIA